MTSLRSQFGARSERLGRRMTIEEEHSGDYFMYVYVYFHIKKIVLYNYN